MQDRDDIIADLLLRWEESFEHGNDVAASDLCKDHPELVDDVQTKIDDLKKMSWMNQDVDLGDDQPDKLLSKTLGNRYRIESLIAQGGFGRVYKAFDPELERHVAVKVPHRQKPNGQVDALVEEARRVAKLRHPGIVSVHDVGREDGTYFIVSELIEGSSLAEVIEAKRQSVRDSVLLVAQIAENLEAAHKAGFVHRDIKPSNILIDENGKPLLTDFGIASTKKADEETATTGTLPYMAPEQIANERQLIDHRADIYSLGVVLYELLTGESPYSARTPGTLREQILFRSPKTIAKETVSPSIEAVCLKCLSKHPADRFEFAEELAKALRQSLNEPPIQRGNLPRWIGIVAVGMALVAAGYSAGKFFNSANTEAVDPSVQGGITFDGTRRIVTPVVNSTLPITIEAWVAPNDVDNSEIQFIVGSDVPGHYGIGMGVGKGGHPMAETVRGGADATRYRFPTNRWSHLAVVFGSDETRVYLNGRLAVTCEPTNQPEVESPFVIGNLGKDQGNMCFTGKLRAVRITAGERFDEEFLPDENFTAGDNSDALLIYDESSVGGEQIKDLSGKENNGRWDAVVVEEVSSVQDREVATMVLGFAGEVEILDSSGRRRILNAREIPAGDFYLTEVKLLSNSDFNDSHLGKLRGLRRLESLYLSGSSITDDGLSAIASLETLRQVGLGNSAITDRGVAILTDLPRLTYLSAGNTKITDDVFESLNKIKNLRQFHVPATPSLSEDAVEKFKEANPDCLVKHSR